MTRLEERIVRLAAPPAEFVQWLFEAEAADVQFVRFPHRKVYLNGSEVARRLLEDPETLLDKHNRWATGADARLFFGDRDGAYFGQVRDFPSHGALLRAVYKDGLEPDQTFGTPPLVLPQVLHSGALILGTDEGAVVSLWTASSEILLPWVRDFLRGHGVSEFTLERNKRDSQIEFEPLVQRSVLV